MHVGARLAVEVNAHGRWWKDSFGRTGQVPVTDPRASALTIVAIVANRRGMDGWELTEVVSQIHGIYRLSFTLAYVMEDAPGEPPT
ncbi:MAG: hypothetical protein IT305_01335 [Chloroflexi bacterium]|nr:hypothetical protein [Chloroflexota bacterium]